MTPQVGDRVIILQPGWNKAIWGYTGTIESIDRETRTNNNRPYYVIRLDQPNPIGDNPDKFHVYPADDEIRVIPRGTSSHTNWETE